MARVLVLPGFQNSGPQHWQSRWEARHPEYRRVEQSDWDHPRRDAWVSTLDRYVREAPGPVVLVAHSLGCITVAHWAQSHAGPVRAAMLVAPADVERPSTPPEIRPFAPVPRAPLPFPSLLVASSDDPYATLERAEAFARSWGSRFVNLGARGHINGESNLGEWPQGEAMLRELLGAAGA